MPRMHSQLISFARSNDEKVITCQECQSAMIVYGQTITAKVSHQNWCKVSVRSLILAKCKVQIFFKSVFSWDVSLQTKIDRKQMSVFVLSVVRKF